MPLYEYKCGKCGQVFELRQKFSDAPLKVHEGCGGAVEKVLSAPALMFKGSGFYINDYARGGGRGGSGAVGDSKSESKPESKSESKSEKKSESKSDSGSAANSPAPASKSEP
jgi:putative FmdB family regulatory protein